MGSSSDHIYIIYINYCEPILETFCYHYYINIAHHLSFFLKKGQLSVVATTFKFMALICENKSRNI